VVDVNRRHASYRHRPGYPKAARMGVAHVDNRSTDGRFLEAAEAEMRLWVASGYAYAAMPADSREHRYGVCPTCTADLEAGLL
jgi:hypothetical protein